MAGNATTTPHLVSRREFLALGLLGAGDRAHRLREPPDGAGQRSPCRTKILRDGEPVAQVVNVETIQSDPFGYKGRSQNLSSSQGLEGQQGPRSGMVYRENGYMTTNTHVIEGANEINVLLPEKSTGKRRIGEADSFTDERPLSA